MLTNIEKREIYIASNPIDFRYSLDGLAALVAKNKGNDIHDGSIYVFFNKNKDRIKCLFWDRNGFVLYYKRLENLKFNIKLMSKDINTLTYSELQELLSGMKQIEHNS